MRSRNIAAVAVAVSLFAEAAARAQNMPAAQAPENVVISASALLGADIDPGKAPVNTQVFSGADLTRFGPADALTSLDTVAVGVSFADAQDNPFQRNLFYRGFEASPLAGDAQGLAVYANGVRLNQPFGDTLNWDLIPGIAIDRLTLEGSNPVFGLNALGGSLSLRMKNGFLYRGAEAEGLAGSFGRFQGSFQYGAGDDHQALYVAGNGLGEQGWRQHSPSQLGQIYADAGWMSERAELHLNLLGAATDLTGNGTSPVELLAAKRNAVFTYPDETMNTYGLANLYGNAKVNDALSFQGNLYLSRLHQRTKNGDASDIEPCDAQPGFLCLDDDLATDTHGNPIADFLSGGAYAQLNSTATDTTGYGGAVQATYRWMPMQHANQLIGGMAIDGGHTLFSARSDLGALSPNRGFDGPGITIDQDDGSIAPVKVASDNTYYGFYAADMFDVTEKLSLNVSARYNIANIHLSDRLGTALNGGHSFARLNPAAGLSYVFAPAVTLYGGYSEASRAPTPAEFSCASPAAPCSLTNFFVGDPSLKQVVARTGEAGLRGQTDALGGMFKWHAGVFRTDSSDDILFVASSIIGRAFFKNIGDTRRQGVESSLDFDRGPWSVSLDYSYTQATFQSRVMLNSPENPLADANGEIFVHPGDSLPNVPEHLFKATGAFQPLENWTIAASLRVSSGVYLQGDESNLNSKTRAYAVVDISSSYRINEHVEIFGTIDNLFDANYATFGTFSPTGDVPLKEAPGADNPRSLAPAAPRAFFGGLRVKM